MRLCCAAEKKRREAGMRIQFEKYTVRIKGRPYDILVPQHIEKLWINGYEWKDFGVVWNGNRRALEEMRDSFAVLGAFAPDSILYFPVRKNIPAETYAGAVENPFDLVLMNHQIQFPPGKMDTGKASHGKAESGEVCAGL